MGRKQASGFSLQYRISIVATCARVALPCGSSVVSIFFSLIIVSLPVNCTPFQNKKLLLKKRTAARVFSRKYGALYDTKSNQSLV